MQGPGTGDLGLNSGKTGGVPRRNLENKRTVRPGGALKRGIPRTQLFSIG